MTLSILCSSTSPAFAMMNATKHNTPEQNRELLRQVTELAKDETKTPEQKLDILKDLGVIGEDEAKKVLAGATKDEKEQFAKILAEIAASDTIHLDGEECTLDTIRQMLAAPDVDLNQKVDVDGIEVTMGDLKTMVEIEDGIQEIADSFLLPEDMTKQQRTEYDSIMNQLRTNGIELQTDDSAIQTEGAGMTYNHDARIQIPAWDVTRSDNVNGKVTVTFTQPALEYETSFDWRTVDGTAQAGVNYTAANGTVIFAPGDTSKSIDIDIKQEDRRWNGQQEFLIACDNPKNILFNNNETACVVEVKIYDTYDIAAYKNSPDRGTMTLQVENPIGEVPESYPYGQTPSFQSRQGQVTAAYPRELTEADKAAIANGTVTEMKASSFMMFQDWPMYAEVWVRDENNTEIAHITANATAEEVAAGNNPLGGGVRTITITEAIKQKLLSVNTVQVEHRFRYYTNGGMGYTINVGGMTLSSDAKPTLLSVTVPDGIYYPGQVVPITATFSEPVGNSDARITVNDQEIGSVVESGANKVLFFYTVKDKDAPNIQITKVSGTKDIAGNAMDDNTETRVFADAKIRTPREDAFADISVDKTNYSAGGETAQADIKLDTTFSEWIEQTGGLEQICVSADGGNTMLPVDWKRTGGDASDDTLTVSVPLPRNIDTVPKTVRIELFLKNEKDGNFYLAVGKYADAAVRPAVYPTDITIDEKDYPAENIIYFAAPPQFTAATTPAFEGLEPSQKLIWSSSNPEIAMIDDDGKVTVISEGAVFFTVTVQGASGSVSASTPEFKTRAGDLPFINMSGNITTSILTDTSVSWNTNVTYKNQQHGTENTVYTVRLYQGADAAAELIEEWEVTNANSFTIPADSLKNISQNGTRAYTVTVTCGHPDYAGQVLTAEAGIITRALPVVVRFDTLPNYFITDQKQREEFGVTFENADLENGVSYHYTVKKNGTTIAEDAQAGYKSASQTFGFDIAPVGKENLRDIYIVSIEANNPGDLPSPDSFILYVYRDGMMDIRVDGENTDKVVFDNGKNPDIAKTTTPDTTSDEITKLLEDAKLSATIGIDRGEYEWSNVDDQIAWNSSNNDAANINYRQAGVYSDINHYDYSTFRPSSEFMLVGQNDGTTTITATHAKTGQSTDLDVSVTTLQDKLYVFNFFPRKTTTMTYTNGNGELRTLTTNDKGEIAVYEESGIKSDISLRSGSEDNLYLGTIYQVNLISSENDPSKLELYPVNSFKLRPAAMVDVYLIKEDGAPYTGDLIVSGGVYKDGKYCAETEMKDETMTIGADGKFHLTLDSTKFWTESNTEPLNAGDQLDYVFIARTPNDEYYPLFINIDGSVGEEEAAVFTAKSLVAAKVPEGKENKPFIAAQTARLPKVNTMWSPVLYFNDVIGISGYADEMEIKTTVLWWGDNSAAGNYDVYMTNEYNARLESQRTSAVTRYPFSDITVSENIVTMTEDTCGIRPGEQGKLKVNLIDGDGTLRLAQDTAFTFFNAVGIVMPDQDSDLVEQLKEVQPDGYGTDTSDPKYNQGGDMVAPGTMSLLSNFNIESQYLTMALYPTNNPGQWQFLVQVGIDKMGDGNGNTVMLDPSQDKKSFLPGPMDAYEMLKGTYKQERTKEFQDAMKSGVGKEASYGGKLGGFYEGIVSWNAEAGKWEMKTRSGGFTYGLAAGYTWSANTMVGPIPITASVSVGGGLEMDHKILMTTHDNGLTKEEFQNLLVTMRINAYTKAFVGIGFDVTVLALKFGVFGQVDLDNYNAFLYYKDRKTGEVKDINGQSTTLTGKTGIEFYLKILFIQYRKILASVEIGSKTWLTNDWKEIEEWRKNANFPSDFGGYNKDTMAALMALSALPEFKTVAEGMYVEDRNYLELAERVWGEPTDQIKLYSLDTPNKMENLQSNSYPYANPMVTEDGQITVFLSDGGEADLNRTRVEFTIYNEATGQYGAPQVLDATDGLADSNLQLAGDNNFAAAAWQRQNQKMDLDAGQVATADDLNAMMSATEICVSVWEDGGWKTEQLTDNKLPDMAPVVAVNGSSAIAVWRRVASTTVDNVEKMSFDARDELIYRVYKNGAWQEEKSLYNGTMGAVKGLSAAMDSEGNAVVTYTVDTANYIGQSAVKTRSETIPGSEHFEIAYSFISADGTAEAPVRFTTDNHSDENPQITKVTLDEEERFVVAWYSQRPLAENSTSQSSDIQLRVVNRDGSLYDNFVDSIREIQNSGSVAIGSQFRFSKGGDSINDLSVVWVSPAMEYAENTNTASYDRDELYAVKFYQEKDGAPVSISAPLPIVSAEENTKIDHFDIYLSKNEETQQLKAVLQTTHYDIDNPALQEVILLEDGESVTLATPISAMKTATGIFENTIATTDPIFDYFSVKHDSSLPMQITVTNTGKDKIEKITVDVIGNEAKKTEFDVSIMPNQSRTLTVYQNLPSEDTLIRNPDYRITAKFADGSEAQQDGTAELQVPDVGISSLETTREENGVRTMQLKLYNRSDIELERLDNYRVKVGFYTDNTCNTPMEGEIRVVRTDGPAEPLADGILTLSKTSDLHLIDNDAFVYNFEYTLPDSGFADGDINIYTKAWIVDAEGNEIAEAYQSNNMGSIVFDDPVERNNGNRFLLSSELADGTTGTHADVTVKNLALVPTAENGNLIVSLLDKDGKVLETQQTIASGELFGLGREESRTFSFGFGQKGVAVRCNFVAVSEDEMDAALSSLEIDGVPIKFDSNTAEYTADVKNMLSANIRASASNADATVQVAGGNPASTGTLTESIALNLPAIDGETAQNIIQLIVTPANPEAPAQTYTIVLNNQAVNNSSIELEAPTWINQPGEMEILVKLRSFAYTPDNFTIRVDDGAESSPMSWLGTTESSVTAVIPDAEGTHTITVRITDEQGFVTTASKEIVVDRTAPDMPENTITFEETDQPLFKANGITLTGIPTENDGITENQLIVHINAADALSGIDKITANAGGRIYTAEPTGDGTYALTVVYAFRGPLLITAYDKAGNATEVTKTVNVDDEMPMGDILTGAAVITPASVTLYGTVTTKDELLADYGIEYRAASEDTWISVPLTENEDRTDFHVTLDNLLTDTDYIYRVYVRSMANTMYYGETKTFRTVDESAVTAISYTQPQSWDTDSAAVTLIGNHLDTAKSLAVTAICGENIITANAVLDANGNYTATLTGLTNTDPTAEKVYALAVSVNGKEQVLPGETPRLVVPRAPQSGNRIISFYLEGQSGETVIGTDTVAVTVPYLTDLTDLSSRLAVAATVQVSENAQYEVRDIRVDGDVLTAAYVVVSESGAEKIYTLTVTREGHPGIDPSCFDGLEQTAGLKTITLTGENLTNADTIEILLFDGQGQEVSRAAAKWNGEVFCANITVPENTDIDHPAVLTFGYLIDGKQTVTDKTISVPKRTSGDCTLLWFDVEGAGQVVVDAMTRRITVEMPYRHDGEEIIPSLTASAYASHEFQNKEGEPITALPIGDTSRLVITAEDGQNTAVYEICVIRQEKPQVYVMTFDSQPNNAASRVAVHVRGVNLKNAGVIEVTASAEDGSLSVTAQAQPSEQDEYTAMLNIPDSFMLFEDRVFKLSAAIDGEPQESIDVSQENLIQPKNDNIVESFTMEGQIGETKIVHNDNTSQGEIRVTVPYDADLSNLKATVTLRDGVRTEPADVTDFSAPVTLRLSGANQADRTYTVTVTNQGAPVLSGLEFEPFTSSKAGELTVTLIGQNTESFHELTLTAVNGEQTVSAPVNLTEGALLAVLNIPENTDPRAEAVWTLSLTENGRDVPMPAAQITVQPKPEILSFTIPNQRSGSIRGNEITVKMPPGTRLTALTPQLELTPNAVILEPTGETVDFTKPVVYTIQLGSDTVSYTVSVSRQSSGSTGGGGGGGSSVSNQKYTVTFETQGGSEIELLKITVGSRIEKPENPTREGYLFDGWFTDEACTKEYDFAGRVTTNITLYAKWTAEPKAPTEPTPEEPSKTVEWKNPFDDVNEDDWFYDAVKYANENGLFGGTAENVFAPDEAITRGMLVTVLWRMEQRPVVNYLMTFDDVEENAYYAEAVRWAASEQIVKGYSDTKFAPDQLITREEIAAVILRYADIKGVDTGAKGDLSQFADQAQISDWARANVSSAVGLGLISGKENGVLDPQGNATRAEAATMLIRFSEKTVK